MSDSRSITVVILAASVTGLVLGHGAGAASWKGTGLVARPVAAGSSAAAAGASAAPARDEGEPDDHGAPGDKPYDVAIPARPPAFVHLAVTSEGGMLRLPGGRFVMGSASPKAPANERPARTMSVEPFWIDRTEVTVGAYRVCVEAGACSAPARSSASCTYNLGDPELPVSCVHWRDADVYCRFTSKRQPTEVEWEYAARGGYAVPFPWGGFASGCANAVTLLNDASGKSCAPRPVRVGSHPGGASLFGVQDMSGNLEEWTADWYVDSLGPGPAPRSGAAHVLRGGGWLSPPSFSRTTSRNWGSSLEAGPNVGFRCARDI
jgi:formylglycine-generating enzyme required for sulfatase activity